MCWRTARVRSTPTTFDIDWHPVKRELANKVLLPVLGDQYGAVLESGQLRLAYENGAFSLHYWEHGAARRAADL